MAPGISFEDGDSIKNYEIMESIGQGAFAIAYRGYQRTTGQEVAIKMIDKRKIKNGSMMKRVRNEVEIHSQLKHPSVLQMFGYFEDRNYVYLVLELCHNGELQQYLKKMHCGMSEEEASKILLQVVIGLLYLHSHGILHRDLSLGNLLLTKEMDVKIADFGLAAKLNMPSEKHYTMCGTPNYISPEIATRSPHGLESDVWSLGCMLYTLLVGEPPFDTDHVTSTLNKVVLAEYKLPENLSAEAKDLIINLLKKNPDDRITLSGMLDHPFMTRTRYKNQNSLDSGHGTFSTTTTNASNRHEYNNILSTNSSTHMRQPSSAKLLRSNSFSNSQEGGYSVNCVSTRGFSSNSNSSCTDHATDTRHSVPATCCNTSRSFTACSAQCSHSQCSFYDNRNHSHDKLTCNHLISNISRPIETQRSYHDNFDCQRSNNINHGGSTSSMILRERNMDALPIQDRQKKKQYSGKENEIPSLVKAKHTDQKNSQQSSDKMMNPLSSRRLRPIRQKTRNAVVSVLHDETVNLEFLQQRSGVNYVIEVVKISSDGTKITVFDPNGKVGVPLQDTPVPLPASATVYTHDSLPRKLWKKYQYAEKFVRLVKMKTPKITFYSSRAKCSLMENKPSNFEVNFYSGSRVSIAETECKIVSKDGHTFKVNEQESESELNNPEKDLLVHSRTCLKHCQLLEHAVEQLEKSLEGSGTYFPLIVGRRPTLKKDEGGDKKIPDLKSMSTMTSQVTSPHATGPTSVSVMSYDGTLFSDYKQTSPLRNSKITSALPNRPKGPIVRASSTSSLDRISENKNESSESVKSAFIDGAGWASQLKGGEIHMQFNDGAQMKFHPTLLVVQYTEKDGQTSRYSKTDSLPIEVKTRLCQLPAIIQKLAQI